MRKLLLLVIVVFALVGAWLILDKSSNQTPSVASTRSIEVLEELVYRNFFDADLQLDLARAYWRKFEGSMKTDSYAASQCIQAYMIACMESGKKREIYSEFEVRFRALAELAGWPDQPFADCYSSIERIFRLFRPNIERIVNLHKEFETTWSKIHAGGSLRPDLLAAQAATDRHLKTVYDVETGRKLLSAPSGEGNMKFTRRFYDQWEKGLRTYGLIIAKRPDLWNDFIIKGSLAEPLGPDASQIMSAESYGRYALTSGDEVVPGLQYFEDAAKAERQPKSVQQITPSDEVISSPPSLHDEESPSAIYRRYLLYRDRGEWSAMYDLMDVQFQHQIAEDVKRSFPVLQNEDGHNRLDAMSGRELFSLMVQCSVFHPTEVVSEEIRGNRATVHTLVLIDGTRVNSEVYFTRINRVWKLSGE